MRDVQLKPVLTHLIFAGVGNINAKEKNAMGNHKFLKTLDDIIKETARQNSDVTIQGRHQIFPLCAEEFQNHEFPQFLPMLWSKQMNPPESKYGDEVVKLRLALYRSILETKTNHTRTQTIGTYQINLNLFIIIIIIIIT